MRDVAFYFRKKTGFPKITDSGLADVVLGGQGLTAVIHLVSADKDKRCVLFSLVFSPFLLSLLYSSLSSFPSLHHRHRQRPRIVHCFLFFNFFSSQDPSCTLRSHILLPRSPSLIVLPFFLTDANVRSSHTAPSSRSRMST